MKYKVGDRVRIKSLDWYYDNRDRIDEVECGNTNFIPDMVKYCGGIVTISAMLPTLEVYHIKEDGGMFNWTDEMIEGLVEDEVEVDLIPKFGEYSDNEPLDIPTMTTEFVKEHGLPCPNGYIFKDENGNVINATKIILEKKKKEYPKTFKECCKILGLLNVELCFNADYRSFDASKEQWKRLGLMNQFYQLLICRDAYWKIAGEEMGLGKPWKPDWLDDDTKKYVITSTKVFETFGGLGYINYILTFPTAEMRDAFKENFDKDLEFCKELL